MKPMGPLRTALFVPATRPDRVDKALSAGADAVIIDLEDAVAHALKTEAREAARKKTKEYAQRNLMVRVNAVGSGHNRKDLESVVDGSLSSIMLPKVDSPEHIREIHQRLLGCERHCGMPPGSVLKFVAALDGDNITTTEMLTLLSRNGEAMAPGPSSMSASGPCSTITAPGVFSFKNSE